MNFFKRKPKKILVPTTEAELGTIVDALQAEYGFTNRQHVTAIVCLRLKHMGPTEAETTLKYFADCIRKNMAYQMADVLGNNLQHTMQVDQLVIMLKSDPNDKQAYDALEKAANEGSAYAKDAFEKLFEREPAKPLAVVKQLTGEESATSQVSSEPVPVA